MTKEAILNEIESIVMKDELVHEFKVDKINEGKEDTVLIDIKIKTPEDLVEICKCWNNKKIVDTIRSFIEEDNIEFYHSGKSITFIEHIENDVETVYERIEYVILVETCNVIITVKGDIPK